MIRAPIPSQVGKLLPMLASDQDFEVVATARAIGRTLQSAGLDFHDLAETVTRTKPARSHLAKARKSRPTAPRAAFTADDANLLDWCLAHGSGWLPAKDVTFLTSACSLLRFRGGTLTKPQRAWMLDIRARIEAREAA